MADAENSADFLDASEEESFLESFDSLVEIAQMDPDIHWGVDPLSMGLSEKLYDELTSQEKNNIERWTYKKLGLSEDDFSKNKVRFYQTKVNGADNDYFADVEVFRTNIEDLFLHVIHYPDGEKRFFLGPDINFQGS